MLESVAFVQWCLDNLNYWTVTFLMTIESSFIPFPSEIIVPPAAYKAATTGEMNVFLVVLFASIGAVLGALINYGLACWLGRPIVYKFANSRLGHMCLLNEEKVKNAEVFFDKHGAVSTFVGRLVPAVRQLISIPAGLARMSLSKFVFFTLFGAGIWNVVLATLGYFLPVFVPSINTEEKLIEQVSIYSHQIGYGILICVVFVLGFLIFKAIKK
ncbi:MAG: DedA family protein [Paludibacteraceae bacterium]|jgi:membrane protein DedA with SNARE-associated domain|nr:DedA family protein [Paludibacteraceae bacterium]